MSHALVIASRELRERSRLFLMCAAMAVLPFIISAVPAAKNDRPMVIAGIGGSLALVMSLGLAVALGTSTIGGDLAARRLSYYFAKPISPAALWIGKVSASLLTSGLAFVIIAVPSMLVAGAAWDQLWTGGRVELIAAILVVAMFLISHVLGTMVRSKSALIGIDFAMFVGTLAALYYIVRPLLLSSAELLKIGVLALGVGILVIFAIAPVWQLAQGRTDLRRSHAALSRAVWASMAVLLLIVAVAVWWVVSMGPEDITDIADLEQAGQSNHFFLTGLNEHRADYHASFLMNADTGAYSKLRAPNWWGMRFSRDGRLAVWMQPYTLRPSSALELYTRRLDDPNATTVATGIRVTGYPLFTVSDDSSRVAIADNEVITIYETSNQRMIASARIPFLRGELRTMFFTSPDLLRVIEYKSKKDNVPVRIYEMSAATRKLEQVGETTAEVGFGTIASSQDGSRFLFRHAAAITDGRSGALISKLPVQPTRPFAAAMLNDGRVAVLAKGEGGVRMHVLTRDGQPIREIPMPFERGMVCAQIGDDKVIVNSHKPSGKRQVWSMHIVDVSRGVVERTLEDVRGPMLSWHETRLTRFAPNQRVAGVVNSDDVVLIDLATGKVSPLPKS